MIAIQLFFAFSLLNLSAYEAVFRASNETELAAAEVRQQQQELLEERCLIEKRKAGFIWPCFLTESTKWDEEKMNHYCKEKLPIVKRAQSLPSGAMLANLTELCQTMIVAHRRILDYKAKEN